MLTRIKGTQDILDTTLRNFVISKTRELLATYDYSEIITPTIEKTELFKRAVGLETDIVSKEMYFVHSGHDNDDEGICLRPEMTAPIVRSYINSGLQKTPWKVFTTGPAFRHERPQKGRFREFYQISVESIGSSSVAGDALFITMLDRLFSEQFMLTSYALIINYLGCHEDRERYKVALHEFLSKHTDTICGQCIIRKDKNVLRTLDCKNPTCQELYQNAPTILDFLCNICKNEWTLLTDLLAQLSISYTIQPRLVRGLDYYNKTIFEFVAIDTLGAQSTFCGGGRYDSLALNLGAHQDYPSIGAGIGIERLCLMLEPIRERLPIPKAPALTLIVPMSEQQYALALLLADELHAQKITTDVVFEGTTIKSKLRKADARMAKYVLIVGDDEQAGKYVTLKNMQSGTELKVPQTDIAKNLT